jgi:hypothetical protein
MLRDLYFSVRLTWPGATGVVADDEVFTDWQDAEMG